ncbi:MAG: phosphate ABC transporter substrate-binding protein [Myxococcaceae bacterium]|nr:phosphate ABC transporter substrate-binding protein [Myxococcaceae bacterium]
MSFIRIAVLALLVPLSGVAAPVTVKGSDTMVILVQRWAEDFMKKNPGTKIQVTGGGSGTGISALLNGTTDIASSSRAIKEAEQEKLRGRYNTPGHEIAVAKDGVAFYVNEKNPLSSLTMNQLKQIYLGDITNWKDVGGPDAKIIVYSRENSSGTYVFVKDHLLNGDDFAASAQTLPGTAAVVNAVAKEKFGIGYGGAAYGKGIRELKVKVGDDEVAPSLENVKSGKYPLARDLYFYLRGKPADEAKGFIDFCLSEPGQKIVSHVGYFPIR